MKECKGRHTSNSHLVHTHSCRTVALRMSMPCMNIARSGIIHLPTTTTQHRTGHVICRLRLQACASHSQGNVMCTLCPQFQDSQRCMLRVDWCSPCDRSLLQATHHIFARGKMALTKEANTHGEETIWLCVCVCGQRNVKV